MGLALALGLSGCGREFYRNWSDQDATEAVFEKSRDPRWILPTFTIEPPMLSRFADPYDPDRPPAPPDDPAAEALSPVPQWPDHRLLVPQEGTGYLTMLEAWQRDRPAPAPAPAPTQPKPDADRPAGAPANLNIPPASSTSPFQPQPNISPGPGIPAPNGSNPGNSGSDAVLPTPTPDSESRPPAPRSSDPSAAARAPRAPKLKQDNGVHLAAFQVPEPTPMPVSPGPGVAAPAGTNPPPAQPGGTQVPRDLGADLDPDPTLNVDRQQPTGLAALLAGTSEPIEDSEAAALPKNGPIYLINPAQAMTLALINNRGYQARIETIYLRSLDVTLARFNFEPQFVAGLAPQTTPRGGLSPNNQNSFLYRTREAPGGQQSTLSFGELAGVGKLLSFGGTVVAGFANSVVFNLVGSRPMQPTVQSVIPITLAQPFLSNGGRAFTLEPLTLAERALLYEIRGFAQFRQQFMPSVLASGQPASGGTGGTTGGVSGIGGNEPTVGFLQVLQQFQVVDNQRKNVAAFEGLVKAYSEMSKGAGSTVSSLNLEQVNLNLQTARTNLVSNYTQFRNNLDSYKIQLGLPPDVPLVLDRGLLKGFRDVFGEIDTWSREPDKVRDPKHLPGFIDKLPDLPDVIIDGRAAVANGRKTAELEGVLLAAERVALENRFDLMNARGALYDQWRQLAVTFNQVKGIFTVGVTNQVFTPTTTTNPFGFWDQAKQFNLVVNAELPLIRVNQRNQFRSAEIRYRQQQRALMLLEDTVKNQVRADIRNMIQNAEQYEIQQLSMLASLRQKDFSQQTIFGPNPGEITANTQALVNAQNQFLSAQNNLISTWVSYQSQRLALYRDLGIMPIDEWEAFYELFPSESAGSESDDRANAGNAAARVTAPRAAHATASRS